MSAVVFLLRPTLTTLTAVVPVSLANKQMHRPCGPKKWQFSTSPIYINAMQTAKHQILFEQF